MSKRVDYKQEYYENYEDGTELISYSQYESLVKEFKSQKVRKPIDKRPKEKEKEREV